MRLERSLLLTLSAALAALSVPALAQQQRTVPVRPGGDAELDACGSLGGVIGLDPRGDNFLSVRSGPGGKPFREVDRLHSGNKVWVCEENGPWLGVVYTPNGRDMDCGVNGPQPTRSAYKGPCRSGWVHRRYINILAG